MTAKQRSECVLNGQIPDVPPHWELVQSIHDLGKKAICIFNGMPPASYRIMLDEYKRRCEMKSP